MRRCERNTSTDITIDSKRIIYRFFLLNNIPGIKRFTHKISVPEFNSYLVSQRFKWRALLVEIDILILVVREPVVTAYRYETDEVGLTNWN
jgi:hypothetical protein